jgi:hypothetical protein
MIVFNTIDSNGVELSTVSYYLDSITLLTLIYVAQHLTGPFDWSLDWAHNYSRGIALLHNKCYIANYISHMEVAWARRSRVT